jgi:lambda repressor-like predicted transcriptional regulator
MSQGHPDGIRLAMTTAVAGTVFIAGGAFWLSFTSLADLARRSGLSPSQAWAWPLIVDGIIVVATVAAVALARSRAAWYPWMLLIAGAAVSVTANAIHALLAADEDVPQLLAAAVAAIPPLVLLAITHLTSLLTRHATTSTAPVATAPRSVAPAAIEALEAIKKAIAQSPRRDGPEGAVALRASGWSNRAIAEHLGVHPSTVGRWLRNHVPSPNGNAERG